MVKCFFEGRLGADAELRTAQNGTNQFYSMRVATDEFKGGETTTVWVNVLIGAERVGKMKFTKGSHVLVTGTLKASIYKTKAGEAAVSLDVMADSINYVKSGGGNASQTTDEATDTGKFTKTENPEAVEAASSSTSADELPF
jgi:single-stranded DNA-binding protein